MQNATGAYVRLPPPYDSREAFVPNGLPPAIAYSRELACLIAEAERALGAAVTLTGLLPEPRLVTEPFVRMEAVLSSRIEGTQTTPAELFEIEATEEGAEGRDIREVANYVRALELGETAVRHAPRRLDGTLLCTLQKRLFEGVEHDASTIGRYRETTVWLARGGRSIRYASYVPPPWPQVRPLMEDWERYVADCLSDVPRVEGPRLVQCAILHAQLEMIHPFADGNGRVGRLLVGLFLTACGHLDQPLLILSPYLDRNRREYYDRLLAISEAGDWTGWIAFFLEGIRRQSERVIEVTQSLRALREEWLSLLRESRAPAYVLLLVDHLFRNPYTTMARVGRQLRVTPPTASKAVRWLQRLGLLEETTGRRRSQHFCARRILRTIETLDESAP